jgi:hypothetical protein
MFSLINSNILNFAKGEDLHIYTGEVTIFTHC